MKWRLVLASAFKVKVAGGQGSVRSAGECRSVDTVLEMKGGVGGAMHRHGHDKMIKGHSAVLKCSLSPPCEMPHDYNSFKHEGHSP